MISLISVFTQLLRRGSILLVLVSLFNLATWFLPIISPSYADVSSPAEAIQEIRKDLAEQDPQRLYVEGTSNSGDPKREVEEKYQENLKEYYQENPEKNTLLGEAKELFNKESDRE
jgi:hypothetical protein